MAASKRVKVNYYSVLFPCLKKVKYGFQVAILLSLDLFKSNV